MHLQAKWDPTLVGAVWKFMLGLGPHRRSLTVSVADESGSCSATTAVHCDFWRKALTVVFVLLVVVYILMLVV